MPDRMRETDAALLAAESARAPRQVAVVMVLQPGERGFDHDGLLRLIDDRIGLVPRYRQRVRALLGGMLGGVLGGRRWGAFLARQRNGMARAESSTAFPAALEPAR